MARAHCRLTQHLDQNVIGDLRQSAKLHRLELEVRVDLERPCVAVVAEDLLRSEQRPSVPRMRALVVQRAR
ncbi:hypothetical protein [Streptomyces lushanensis]|uniref:hypothetical protein n=1 Tax=Streptomyces lushanensis TaxID=1434255 RepID=UPI00083764E1|nr:hypothetical protein [Streptomyces lushanensis]